MQNTVWVEDNARQQGSQRPARCVLPRNGLVATTSFAKVDIVHADGHHRQVIVLGICRLLDYVLGRLPLVLGAQLIQGAGGILADEPRKTRSTESRAMVGLLLCGLVLLVPPRRLVVASERRETALGRVSVRQAALLSVVTAFGTGRIFGLPGLLLEPAASLLGRLFASSLLVIMTLTPQR